MCSNIFSMQELKQENAALKKELSDIRWVLIYVCMSILCVICSYNRAVHKQLIHEAPQENFSEKRVNLLKSQIFQLERQVSW